MTHNQDTNPAPGNDVNNPIREQVQRIRPVAVFRRGRNFRIGSKIDCRAIKLFQKPIRDYTTCFVAVVVAGVSTAACGELAQLHVLRDDVVEVVDGIEVDVVEPADCRVDVARYGEVDEEHRLVAPPLDGDLDRRTVDDRQRARGRRHHDVGFPQPLRDVGERNGLAVEFARELLRARQRAIGDDHAPDVLPAQVVRDQRDGVAGADQQRRLGLEVAVDLAGEAHGGVGDGDRGLADRGFGTDLLRHREGVLHQLAQRLADGAFGLGGLVGLLQLTEDLRLAEDHGIEPAGHAQGVPNRLWPLQRIEVAVEQLGIDRFELNQPVGELSLRWAVRREVELGAVAGREDDGLFGADGVPRALERRAELLAVERDLLANVDGRSLVAYAEDDDRHEYRWSRWLSVRCRPPPWWAPWWAAIRNDARLNQRFSTRV